MARRGRKPDQERNSEAYAVLEQTEGPHGPETFSVAFTEWRLTQRSWGHGAAQVTQWFVDGLPVASREAAAAALLLPPPPGAQPPLRREVSADTQDVLERLVRGLAIAEARRDHARDLANRLETPTSLTAEKAPIK